MVLNGVLCDATPGLSGVGGVGGWGVERPWTRAPQGEDTMGGDLERWPVGADLTD